MNIIAPKGQYRIYRVPRPNKKTAFYFYLSHNTPEKIRRLRISRTNESNLYAQMLFRPKRKAERRRRTRQFTSHAKKGGPMGAIMVKWFLTGFPNPWRWARRTYWQCRFNRMTTSQQWVAVFGKIDPGSLIKRGEL